MSIFPTRILLATDGSEEAELAASMAVELADATDSELHVVHVGVVPTFLKSYPGTLGYYGKLLRADRRGVQGAAPETVVAGEGRRGHRGRDSPQDGAGGSGDRGLGRGARSGPDRDGLSGARRSKTSADGQRLRLGCAPCPLPCVGGPSGEGTGGLE